MPRLARSGTFQLQRGVIVLRLPPSIHLLGRNTHFFPDENGYWDAVKARVISTRPLRIASPAKGKVARQISGVVSDGSSAFRLRFVAASRH